MKAKTEEDREPGNPADKENFVALVRQLYDAFRPHGLLLTAAVSPAKSTIDRAYDVQQLNQLLDYISVMSYYFHVGKEDKTGMTWMYVCVRTVPPKLCPQLRPLVRTLLPFGRH